MHPFTAFVQDVGLAILSVSQDLFFILFNYVTFPSSLVELGQVYLEHSLWNRKCSWNNEPESSFCVLANILDKRAFSTSNIGIGKEPEFKITQLIVFPCENNAFRFRLAHLFTFCG